MQHVLGAREARMNMGAADGLNLHKSYWNRQDIKRPLIGFKVGAGFFSSQFKSARHLFVAGQRITPDMVDVDAFLEEYDKMFHESLSIGQDAFWAAEPFNAVPWLEAILGCDVYGTEHSLVTHPCVRSVDELEKISLNPENPWFCKYMEFLSKLDRLAAGRFPAGQPLLRGCSDAAGALIGQTELICALCDEPERMKGVLLKISGILIEILRHHYERISAFHGGYSMGMYPVWAPGKCIWFQEDLSALLSPSFYREFLKEPDENLCKAYEFSLMHLHPVSFFILDEVLAMDGLTVIEVNKDVEGPSIKQMLPVFRKILDKKNLLVSGELDEADIACVLKELRPRGIFLHIIAQSLEHAKRLMEYVLENSQRDVDNL